MNNLFYWRKKDIYLWRGFPMCSICNKEILAPFVYKRRFTKKHKEFLIFCYDCYPKFKSVSALFEEQFLVSPMASLPSGVFPVLDLPPSLSDRRGFTVFDAVSLPSETVEDNTVHCHNQDFMIEDKNEGVKLVDCRDQELSEVLNDQALLIYLEEIKSAEPIKKSKNLLEVRKL